MKISPLLGTLVLLAPLSLPAVAQRSAPAGTGEQFKNTSMLKPPAGAKIAIIEWQDLTCPNCAHAFPIVHAAAAKYKIPLVQHDFLLGGEHAVLGDKEAAIWARYLEDKVSPAIADQYRGAVFAAQGGISSKQDMANFTRRFFQSHHMAMPFVPDPTGQLTKEVMADNALGEKLGVQQTACIIVCTPTEWVHVTDLSQLYPTIEELQAKASAGEAKPIHVRKKARS
ncbi:MAG TPA: thioredoxin domain-containing protein [Acidobacteriaceae bacterium]|nr:thioredoxin domain-containing protein [Acidobacteriaceae bacterium]